MSKSSLYRLPLVLGCVSVCLSGCETVSSDLPSYPSSARGQAMQVFEVEVVSVRPVALRGEATGIGALSGGLAGGIAGSMIGQGSASALTAVGGALVGGLAGNEIEKSAGKARGVQITVRTYSGQTWSVLQEDNGEFFQPGEHVQMLVGPDRRIITR
jgi:outer membrane lipoprotein SlyB